MYIHPFYVIISANMRRFGVIHPKFEHLRSQILFIIVTFKKDI